MSPSPTRTTTTDEGRQSCPYAVALEDDEQASQTDTSSLDYVMAQAKKSCPAFSGGDCPFATPQDVRKTLIQVPKSHYNDAEGKTYNFKQALQHLHTIGSALKGNEGNEFTLSACPATGLMEQEQTLFALAMEKISLASIMSRMAAAQELGDEHDHYDDDEEDKSLTKSTIVAPRTRTSKTTTTTEASSSISLSQALKTGTAVAHQAAEDVHFVQNFIKGQIDRHLYADLVLSLYHVYDKMEALLQTHHTKHFVSCHFPHELNRTATLREDVDFWHGDNSNSYISPATQDYMDRLDMLAQTQPLLLLAHAYTRYFGDLSGGKVLARVAKRALQLQDDGLAFYHFQHVKSAKAFKDQYRSCLDSLHLSSTQIDDLVKEANVAFLLNMRLFEELDVKANVPGVQVRDWQDTLAALEKAVASGEKTIPDECPFAKTNGGSEGGTKSTAKGGRCPWPFVFMHDPVMALQDYQTWIVVGLVLCWAWSAFAPTVA